MQEKKTNAPTIISTTLLMVIVLFLVFGWWYNNNTYTQQFESNFMANCNGTSGGNSNGCACVYSKLKNQYSFTKAKEFDANPSGDEAQTAFHNLAAQCI